jgi:hypothetical protein
MILSGPLTHLGRLTGWRYREAQHQGGDPDMVSVPIRINNVTIFNAWLVGILTAQCTGIMQRRSIIVRDPQAQFAVHGSRTSRPTKDGEFR